MSGKNKGGREIRKPKQVKTPKTDGPGVTAPLQGAAVKKARTPRSS